MPENAMEVARNPDFFLGQPEATGGLMSEGHQLPTTTILMFMLAQMSNHKCPLE